MLERFNANVVYLEAGEGSGGVGGRNVGRVCVLSASIDSVRELSC